MPRKTDDINAALFAVIDAVPNYDAVRNVPLGSFEDGKFISLIDGESGDPVEEFINGEVYEFEATASLIIAIEGDDLTARRTWVAGALSAIGAAIETDKSLGGLVTNLQLAVDDTTDTDLFGSADITAAEMTITLDYWTNSRLG